MVLPAQPAHNEGLIIIVVVHLSLFAAGFAAYPVYSAALQGVIRRAVSQSRLSVFSPLKLQLCRVCPVMEYAANFARVANPLPFSSIKRKG